MDQILQKSFKKGISYQDYRNLVSTLVEQKKSTGNEQSDDLSNYTSLNNSRMKRLDKTLKISTEKLEKIKQNKHKQTWLLITESWCGDAAQTVPMINKIAEASENIDLKIVLRDENDELMQQFLTNGNKAIPILIGVDKKTNTALNNWGPRPTTAAKLVNDYKKEHGGLDAQFKEDLQKWYNKDKGQDTLEDILNLFF
ncbi:thioredoxin family protein [Flavicella sediminum]|uniref:thioredoxin family protein n=1 Tax=Flavicella sediminum TaxID=2585141 RepID=UPI00112328B0|nr:thioredoxin family protein [Flavicella sediminum]